MIYQTDGAPAKVVLGNWQIVFHHNTGRRLALAGRASGLVAQALRDAGVKEQLTADVGLVPAWRRPIFLRITRPND